MKKEVRNYLSIGFLVLAVLVLAYLLNLGMTGFVVLEGYNQTNCTDAGYVWEDLTEQNCTDIVDCTLCVVECETNCTECVDVVIGAECVENITLSENDCGVANYTWQETTEQNCTDIVDCTLCVVGCETNCTSCETIITGGQCTREEPFCNNTLTLCLDETNCTDAEGYWYNEECNLDECANDENCDSGYECDAGGSCVEIEEEETEETGEEETTEEIVSEPSIIPSLSVSEISALSLNPGGSQKATLVVTNTGTTPLISCIVRPVGEFDSWVLVSEEATNISIGKQHEFSFDVTVPEETEESSYSLRVRTKCSGISAARDLTVNVEKKKLEFEVISADRTRLNRVRIIYSLEELAGEDQDVVFIFSLVDANNIEVGRVEVNQSIDANSTDEFRTNININESLLPINETTNETLESELTLNVNFNSQIYSSSIQEKVLIGAPIGGFAILEGVGTGEAIIFVVVLFVLVFIFVFARRMRRKGKTLKDVFKGKGPEPA